MFLSGWKTIIFSTATTALGILQSTQMTEIVAQHPGLIMTLTGIITFLLRIITNTAPAMQVTIPKKNPAVIVPPATIVP